MSEDRCVCCGAIVPEGTQICTSCSEKAKEVPKLENCGSCRFYTKDGWCGIFFIRTKKNFKCRYDYEPKENGNED